ncbi:MAG: response regulator [Acetatifactor sp.]|nr:response regulator [Acetatifactor sp.]
MAQEGREDEKILIVDDVEANRFVLRDIVQSMGYIPILAENGEQALKVVERFPVQLVILDIAMPVMDGYECCRMMKADARTRNIPIVFISAFDEPEDIVQGFALGGEDYITKPFIPEVVKARVKIHLRLYEANQNLMDLNRKLQTSVNAQLKQMEAERKNVLYALGRVARENAHYDKTNMERLSHNCRVMAEALQLTVTYSGLISDTFVSTIEIAAPLCDIGNLTVPTDILQKTGELTKEEMQIMQTHPTIGAKILRDIQISSGDNDFLQMSIEIVNYHHENWDGTGYPTGKEGNDIPLPAQIVAVVNSFCALTESRSYREAYTPDEAIAIMEEDCGVKFNPEIFSVLKKIHRQMI